MKNPEIGDSSPKRIENKEYIVEIEGGDSITVEETESGTFKIVDNSMAEGGDPMYDKTNIGFDEWDKDVQDLDGGHSDASECFGISEHLRWEDVEFTPDEIKAPSIDRLKEALQHIRITSYCPGEI